MSSFREGDGGRAFLSFAKAALVFIIFPLSMYALLQGLVNTSDGVEYAELFMNDQMIGLMKETVERAIKYSIPFLIIAIPMGFYARGNAAKIPFRIIWALYTAIWIWVLAQGGLFTTALNDLSFGTINISSVSIALDLTAFLYITLMICVTKAFLAFSEYGSYRKEYLESLEEKEKKRKKREEKKAAKA